MRLGVRGLLAAWSRPGRVRGVRVTLVLIASSTVLACGASSRGSAPSPAAMVETSSGPPLPTLPVNVTYDRASLTRALDAVRVQLAKLATEDHGADARVLAGRESLLRGCAERAEHCPPSLTSGLATPHVGELPPVLGDQSAALTWMTAAHQASCACAVSACVEGWTEALQLTEAATSSMVIGDLEVATNLTAARECLWILRGNSLGPS